MLTCFTSSPTDQGIWKVDSVVTQVEIFYFGQSTNQKKQFSRNKRITIEKVKIKRVNKRL